MRSRHLSAGEWWAVAASVEEAEGDEVVGGPEPVGDAGERTSTSNPFRAGNLLEVVSVLRDDGAEIVIHATPMGRTYESFLHDEGDDDD